MGSLRVGHDWTTSLSLFTFMHWRRKWQPTPVFWPGESQGRGSLVGYSPWGRKESDTTEVTYLCWHSALGLFTAAAALFFLGMYECCLPHPYEVRCDLICFGQWSTNRRDGYHSQGKLWESIHALVNGAWTDVMGIIPRESYESQYVFYEFLFSQTSSVLWGLLCA